MQKCRLDYKWVIAAMCFLMVFAGLGFCSSAKSIYTAAITNALGFSRSAFSVNDSLRYITTAVANLFFGALVARYGTKKLIAAGMVCLIVSSLFYSFASSLLLFYLGGFFLGLGVAWTTTSMVGAVINKWFKKNTGTVLGAVLASNGVGAAVAIQITTPIIYQEGNAFGFRSAYFLVAVILTAVTAVIMIFYRENPPEDMLEDEPEEAVIAKTTVDRDEFEYSDVTGKPFFYVLIICTFVRMLAGVGGIVTPHMTDIGLDPDFVAWALSLQVMALAIFKFGIGFIYDRFGLKSAVNICLIAGIASLALLFIITNSLTGKILTVMYSLLSALSAPIDTVLLPVFVLDFFGSRSFNKTLGILTAASTAGSALGAPLVNITFDLFNSYQLSFVYCFAAYVIATVLTNWSMYASAKDKKRFKSCS